MTILFYEEKEMSPNAGGVSRINCNLRDSLSKKGYDCIFLSSSRDINIPSERCQLWLPNQNEEDCEENALWLHELIISNNIGIIINNCFNSSTVRFLDKARKGTQCKIITWVHNNIIEYGSLVGFRSEMKLRKMHLGIIYKLLSCRPAISSLRYLVRYKHKPTAEACYLYSDKIINVCESNIDEFVFLLGHKDKDNKILAISNFIPTADDISEDEKANSVVWCGTVGFELKKTNWMLDIWRSVQQQFPDWELTIMGDSVNLDKMKDYAKNIGVERVIFTGRVNPTPFYETASIICSTSITESFGLSIVEGMQRRVVPIAFSSSKSIRDIVGNNGKLIKPFDKKQFSRELAGLMSDKTQRDFLSEKCRASASQYDEENVIRLWVKLIHLLTTK